jgi:hypothetical protein
MNQTRGEHWMATLMSIWRHTPLGIMLNGLMKPPGEPRMRQVNRDRSEPVTPVLR